MSGFIGIGVCVVFSLLMNSASFAANPYKMGYVDFFDRKNIGKVNQINEEEFDFREPIIAADGSVTYYSAPSAVLKLLESPTSENARAYISWQKQKVAKISKAQEMIDQIIKEEMKE